MHLHGFEDLNILVWYGCFHDRVASVRTSNSSYRTSPNPTGHASYALPTIRFHRRSSSSSWERTDHKEFLLDQDEPALVHFPVGASTRALLSGILG